MIGNSKHLNMIYFGARRDARPEEAINELLYACGGSEVG